MSKLKWELIYYYLPFINFYTRAQKKEWAINWTRFVLLDIIGIKLFKKNLLLNFNFILILFKHENRPNK